MKKMIRLMSVALVALALVACGSKGAKTPEAATEAFLKEYKAGNYEALVDQMHFSTELTKEQKDGFVSMIKEKAAAEIEKKQGIADYEIGEVVIAEDGQSAKVNYILKYGDGSEKKDKLSLVLVEDKWRVDGGK